jgi:hypothetical protein
MLDDYDPPHSKRQRSLYVAGLYVGKRGVDPDKEKEIVKGMAWVTGADWR